MFLKVELNLGTGFTFGRLKSLKKKEKKKGKLEH
jgi:hypothetical protein